jgi:hypothetical protein
MDEMDRLKPWHQRDDEPANAYRAFLCWRDLAGDRTMSRAYREYTGNKHAGQAPDFFSRWAEEYDWPGRTLAWDRYVRDREDEAQLSAREERAAERGHTLADLEADNMSVLITSAKGLKAKLDDPRFWEAFMPQQVAPFIRALNEGFKVMASYRHLKDSDAEGESISAEEEAKIDALFNKILNRREEDEED